MILQSLVRYYEALVKQGSVVRPGWCQAKVSYALELSKDGELLNIISLKEEQARGKKMVETPKRLLVPEMVSRSSGVSANFLCDNAKYILGIDKDGITKRVSECFQCAREKHLKILEKTDCEAAVAVKSFFHCWTPQKALENGKIRDRMEEITAGANLIFMVNKKFAQEDREIQKAWEEHRSADEEGETGICLVTGERSRIARTHGTIKGVQGAQAAGAALVSFNAPSFCSYGKDQSFNAPVGDYAVFAYTTALNDLISNKKHTSILGNAIVVYWAEDGEEEYQNMFENFSDPKPDTQELLQGVFKNLEEQKAVQVDQVIEGLSMGKRFYILALSPNAARLSVRFFYQDTFGNILTNLKKHYDRMEIARSPMDTMKYLGVKRMLQETVNKKSKDKKPPNSMSASLLRAILSGERYPDSLYQAVLGRIKAEQDDKDKHIYKITRGRAAIIKAFLLQNSEQTKKEEILVELNENNKNVPYILGREFAVLEKIQKEANPDINATIKDKYFNSACATPAAIFPILFKLKNSHTRKFAGEQEWKEGYYEKMLETLQGMLPVSDTQSTACPRRLSLEEQGMFILGYYQQVQKLFEKKDKGEN